MVRTSTYKSVGSSVCKLAAAAAAATALAATCATNVQSASTNEDSSDIAAYYCSNLFEKNCSNTDQATGSNTHLSSCKLIAYDSNKRWHSLDSNAPLSRLVLNKELNLFERADRVEKSIDYYVNDIWQNGGDARTREFPFVGTGPWKLLYATGFYLLLIKHLLPKLMHYKKEAFELAWPIRIYNLAMVVANMFAFTHGARILRFGSNCFGCQLVDPTDKSEKTMELLHYGWLFLMSRLVEWLDTVFFVLRKRERQITKLHVFHHSFVPLISWTYLKYHPSYTMAFFPFINSFVHSIMYSYYFLATFGRKVQPYLWWKRYLTSLQIVQFVLILIQLTSIPLSANERCSYPRGFIYFAFAGAILFLWLFYTYYIDTYTKAAAAAAAASGKIRPQQHKIASPNNKHTNKAQHRTTGVITATTNGTTSPKTWTTITSHLRREGASKAVSDLIDNSIEE